MTTSDDFRRWLSGIPYEVGFWRSYYANRRRRRDLFSWSLYDKPCVLDGFDIDGYISRCASDNPKILDVGCALSYAFGNIICGKPADVSYVDPLAPFYNKILRRYHIDRPAIHFGMIECLSGSFAPETVDFIHVRNALDHCADPFAGIVQCLVVLREGGVLYLNHFVNEAQNEGYRGFHQFNLCMKGDSLVLWNKSVEIDVTERLGAFADVVTTVTPEGRVVAVITRKAPVPAEIYDPRAVAMRMTDDMMTTVEYFHSLPTSASYQLKRLVATLGHRTMRLIPLSLLKRIKRLAGK